MNIAYFTTAFPCTSGEAFIGDEVDGLAALGLHITLVPVCPVTAPALASGHKDRVAMLALPLFRFAFLGALRRLLLSHPGQVWALLGCVVQATGMINRLHNLAVLPKAVWLAEWVRKSGIDHIHAHWGTAPASMALMVSRLANIPWSVTYHRYDIVANNLLAEKINAAAFSRFISRSGLDMARSLVEADWSRAEVLHMGVGMSDDGNLAVAFPGGSLVVLCPAGLHPVKGHAVLIRAVALCVDAGVPVELLLAGDGPERAPLEALVLALGLSPQVRFLGNCAHEDLLTWYQKSEVSVVALASLDLGNGLHEGIPVALMEAMAHGIPVVSTRTGGIPELLDEGAGLLVPPDSPAHLAEALSSLWRDPGMAEKYARNGRARVEAEFNRERICRRLASDFSGGIW